MPSIQHLVTPKVPTILADRTHVDLPGYDVWFSYVTAVYVVPAALDPSKFEDALARALQLYPHAAGQLRCVDGRWAIELTNTSIPVDIEYKLDTTPDSFLQDDWVIQDDISPFISQQPTDVDIVNGTAPLFRVKLTFFGDDTCIGLSWHHSLGDGTLAYRLYHTLSQFYQGLPAEFSAPTYEKPDLPQPTQATVAKFSPQMPRLVDVTHLDDSESAGLHDSHGHVKWRIDNQELEVLQSTLCSNGQQLSKLDCLTAYVVAVLNHIQSNLVQNIRYVISVRDANVPFMSESLASNMTVQTFANASTDMAAMATTIRDTLRRSRQPEYIYHWVSVISKLILDAATIGEVLVLSFTGDLMVNSMAAVDFGSAHYGCPNATRFYMDRPWQYYLRILKPNPMKGEDGVWRARQSVEISLGVPPDLRPGVLEVLGQGVRYMLHREPVHVHARL